jgi:hypothetical protein
MARRQSNVWMILLSGLLLFCLAFLEFPEMSALEDDTSNDFTILTTDSGRLPVFLDLRVTTSKTESRVLIFADVAKRLSASELSPTHAPQDLLPLYSIWRT